MDVRTIPRAEAGTSRRPGAAGWMLAAPMFAWLALFVIAPTVILFVYSFCQRDEMGELIFSFSLENYAGLTTVLCFSTYVKQPLALQDGDPCVGADESSSERHHEEHEEVCSAGNPLVLVR